MCARAYCVKNNILSAHRRGITEATVTSPITGVLIHIINIAELERWL
jgi:hypothetical protein